MRIASWLASWKGSNYSRRKTRASSKAFPRPSPRLSPSHRRHTQHIAPPLPQYRQEPSVSLPDKFNGNRLKTAHLSQPAGAGVSYQPQPIQLGGNQGGHSRDLLTDVAASWFNPIPREPHDNHANPPIPGQLSGLLTGHFQQRMSQSKRSRHSAPDSRNAPVIPIIRFLQIKADLDWNEGP
ncbi:hypothetical protein BASA81_013902 [Batrachochytrium salamandrivorans]|nr:hypothetical protein BASA81_013902 [Batrachochytrium salamandrivorans]